MVSAPNSISHLLYLISLTKPQQKAYIVSAARTPITQFMGSMNNVPATFLGSIAIKATIAKANLASELVEEIFFGQVLQGGAGQAPARQAALGAGLPKSVICTTVNKVCASGMKAIMFAAQSIKAGDNHVVVAGGMESMSQVPWFLHRIPKQLGNITLADGILIDGLTDAYGKYHMGICAENTCEKLNITRLEQDKYALDSYRKSAKAHVSGLLAREICPVDLPTKRPSDSPRTVFEDEEFRRIDVNRISNLRPAFKEGGTVTAANASPLNDGAAATLIMSSKAVEQHKLKPIAEIYSYADAACEPIDFPIAPALSIPKVRFTCSFTTYSNAQVVEYDKSQTMDLSKFTLWESNASTCFSSPKM